MKDKLSTTGAVNVLIAFLILLARLMPSPAEAAEAKPREMLKLRLGLGSAPAPPLPNSVLWLANGFGFYVREGLDLEMTEVQSTPLAIAAMVSVDVVVAKGSASAHIRINAAKCQPH